jgi:hypothetical protein
MNLYNNNQSKMKKRAQATNLLEQVFKNKEVKPIYKIP